MRCLLLVAFAASVHGFAQLKDATEAELRTLIHNEAHAEAEHMIEEMQKSKALKDMVHEEVVEMLKEEDDEIDIFKGRKGMIHAKRRALNQKAAQHRQRRRLQTTAYTAEIHGMHATSIDHVWILVAGLICFFLQAGFALLEAGAVQAKNAKNIALKNLMDAVVGGIVYYLFGYALAYGSPGDGTGNPFIGGESGYAYMLHDAMGKDTTVHGMVGAYGLTSWPADLGAGAEYHGFFFQYVFAATIATIVSGAVAERIKFGAYMMYSFILTGIIYPPVSHWIWSADGFLYKLGTMDYAGGGAVHALSGVAAFMGAQALGPRIGAFTDGKYTPPPPHNASMMALGVFVLWFGFIPFNAGSGVTVIGWMAGQTGRVAVMTTMGGCSGGMTGLLWGMLPFNAKHPSLEYAINGVLAGMVSVCGCCAVVPIWAVFWIISPMGVLSFYFFMWVNKKCKVDDPLGASALHYGPGAWGVIMVGFFAKPDLTTTYYGCSYGANRVTPATTCADYLGLFYGGSGQQLGIQLLALTIYTVYGFITCTLLFYGMKLCKILRVSEADELAGMDSTHHGGPAYIFGDSAPKKAESASA